jgi:hypothetical protein
MIKTFARYSPITVFLVNYKYSDVLLATKLMTIVALFCLIPVYSAQKKISPVDVRMPNTNTKLSATYKQKFNLAISLLFNTIIIVYRGIAALTRNMNFIITAAIKQI